MSPRLAVTGAWTAAAAALLLACAGNHVVPASLRPQVDRHLTFVQLKQAPDSYRGRLVVLGGEVLSAKRLKNGTRIEILQLPLGDSQEPGWDRTASEGRFLAVQPDFLDPATIPPGTRVTVTGEVTGATALPLDEMEYTYPTLEIKHLKVWPQVEGPQYGLPPYAHPYWRPYWGRYPYWW
ncbi:MAG: Slp family lipoprotein [Nitrospirota bacterium]